MGALGNYTTTEAVRGCLGIDLSDCPEEYLQESGLEMELAIDLDSWLSTHAAVYAAGNASGATAAQIRSKNLVLLYGQWFCAHEIAARPLTFLKSVGDGKNQAKRFDLKMSEIKGAASGKKQQYKDLLNVEVNAESSSIETAHGLVTVASPSGDTVLNT